MSTQVLNLAAIEPLFAPHEEPNLHRVRALKPGDPAQVVKGRRPTGILVTQNLRGFVGEWRENDYPGPPWTHPTAGDGPEAARGAQEATGSAQEARAADQQAVEVPIDRPEVAIEAVRPRDGPAGHPGVLVYPPAPVRLPSWGRNAEGWVPQAPDQSVR